MQTRQTEVSGASLRREEQAGGWHYSYTSRPGGRAEQPIAWVSVTAYSKPVPYLTASVPVDDDAWSEETLPVADFIAKIKTILAEAIVGAL